MRCAERVSIYSESAVQNVGDWEAMTYGANRAYGNLL